MRTEPNDSAFSTADAGLTKREYFAAMAMQGLIAGNHLIQPREFDAEAWFKLQTEACANNAVRFADALISELNKPDPATNPMR